MTGSDRQYAKETALNEIDNSLTYYEALDEIDRKFGGKSIAYTDKEIVEGTAQARYEDLSDRSKAIDESRLSKKIIYGGSKEKDIDVWLDNPSKSDFEGLDTPTTKVWPKATDIERKIIDAIHTKDLSVSQIAALTTFSKATIRKKLKSLEEKAYIKKSESNLKGKPVVYRAIVPRSARKRQKIPKHIDTNFKRLKITTRKIEATCPPGTTIQLKELKSGIQLSCKVMD